MLLEWIGFKANFAGFSDSWFLTREPDNYLNVVRVSYLNTFLILHATVFFTILSSLQFLG